MMFVECHILLLSVHDARDRRTTKALHKTQTLGLLIEYILFLKRPESHHILLLRMDLNQRVINVEYIEEFATN